MLKKRKNYIVTIITKKNKININVKAFNANEAKGMVEDVLIRCNYFGHKSLSDFKLITKSR